LAGHDGARSSAKISQGRANGTLRQSSESLSLKRRPRDSEENGHCEKLPLEQDIILICLFREVIRLRIRALEKRVSRPSKAKLVEGGDRSTKKAKHETPRKAIAGDGDTAVVPPSTIRRMVGYVWGGKATPAVEPSTEYPRSIQTSEALASEKDVVDDHQQQGRGKGKEREVQRLENKLLTRLRGGQAPVQHSSHSVLAATAPAASLTSEFPGDLSDLPMRQVAHVGAATRSVQPFHALASPSRLPITVGVSSSATSPRTAQETPVPHPSSAAWRTSSPPSIPMAGSWVPTRTAPSSATSAGPNAPPARKSTFPSPIADLTRSSPSSAPQALPLYPPLHPPISQRSTALRALFEPTAPPASTSKRTESILIPARGRMGSSTSVKDLVRSFEDEGVIGSAIEGGLRRSESLGSVRGLGSRRSLGRDV